MYDSQHSLRIFVFNFFSFVLFIVYLCASFVVHCNILLQMVLYFIVQGFCIYFMRFGPLRYYFVIIAKK